MLRWKKQEAKKGPEQLFEPVVSDTSMSSTESPVPVLPAHSTESKMVLDNIPSTISASSVSVASSTSSICSESAHVVQPLPRHGDEEKTVSCVAKTPEQAPDSILESTKVTVRPNNKRKQPTFCRKVSDSDLSSEGDIKKIKVSNDLPRSNIRLLASSEDAKVLNPLHVFCRMQIEVFTATPTDMAQPAPGRKNPIRLNQVGLRCIHCKHLPPRDRVKRAVCYPSSVGRVYHSVSDMKFDHFSNCRGLSEDLRAKLATLKKQCKRRGADKQNGSSGSSSSKGTSSPASTAQYYHDCARKMGMSDSNGGIFMSNVKVATPDSSPLVRSTADVSQESSLKQEVVTGERHPSYPGPLPPLPTSMLAAYDHAFQYRSFFRNSDSSGVPRGVPPLHPMSSVNYSSPKVGQQHLPVVPRPTVVPPPAAPYSIKMLLASELDPQYLNTLHCFVRRNVEVFVATDDDVTAPAPGRKNRVTRGQVGIRCINCARLPIKNRVKRAVCYPPTVSGIYHSVSNMKFDHFGNCQGLSTQARDDFTKLKAACNRRSGGSGGSSSGRSRNGSISNSTAQYYHDSALRLGLIDTEQGIRFGAPVHQSSAQQGTGEVSPSQSAHDGISALMIAATNPDVRRASTSGMGKPIVAGKP